MAVCKACSKEGLKLDDGSLYPFTGIKGSSRYEIALRKARGRQRNEQLKGTVAQLARASGLQPEG